MAETAFAVAPPAAVLRAGRALVRRHRGRLAVVTATFLLAAGCGLVGPWAVGRIVDEVSGDGGVDAVARYGVVMAIALAGQAAFSALAGLIGMRTGERVFADLRESFMTAVTRLPLGAVERAGTGDLVTRTTRDVGMVSDTVRFGLPQLLQLVVTVVATVVAAVLVDARVSLAMLVILLVGPVVVWYLRRSRPVWERVGAAFSDVGEDVSANARSARDIDLLGLDGVRRDAVDSSLRGLYRARRHEVFLRTVLIPSTNLAFSVPLVVTLLWGGWLAERGMATAGAVAAVVLYNGQLARPVEQLIDWVDELQQSWVSYARILGVESDVERGVAASEDAASLQGALELDRVTFAYRPGEDVLHGVSLATTPGERLAVVGPSGSGKSTIARLMSGIDRPRTGAVRIGGVDLAGFGAQEVRRTVCLVTQEHHVFVGTLAENLRLARRGATDGELEGALRAVGVDWQGELDDGLDTSVGAGGLALTPVQAQQVALARVLLLDPDILVLDEATSMFDATSARTSERAVSAALAGRTVVAIAHRLQTAADADRVAVVVDGRVLELGSHDELLDADGEYARLWRAWQG
ncbi:ABC transporter related [Beutenbergia cavernae DSM 12333]|uniref:ABC transporter related n=1 Tax=Beutenbergia cavernae (strain ATCC BAA-8 / DSM 12333 / CCUG 43141 / JCM 11478 / NBRC 16432 / NCIMB 13614 / HKI 0122) TaxID=471853 RepID=C5C3Q9_BEUC1|nr:ABC transporter ATP-binding protein [Beutenbergia cavernae]ACQ81968.1 ABC transporter related [Beutenbergia cavernae DSM 12333]